MNKTVMYIVGAFIGGLVAGGTASYIYTKKDCEIHTQQAIDEMKAAHKKELADIRKEIQNEPKESGQEDGAEKENEGIFEEKQSSMPELSSLYSGENNTNSVRTKYNLHDIKTAVQKIRVKEAEPVKEVKTSQHVIDYSSYMSLDEEVISETNFLFNCSENIWRDWQGVEYDEDELPFETEDIQWVDDQCYILDDDTHEVYVLEKKA